MTPPLDERLDRIEKERLAREARERAEQERADQAHRVPHDSHVAIDTPKGSIRIHAGNITIKDIVYALGALAAAVTWYQNLANKKYVDDVAAASVTTSAAAAASIAASAVAVAVPPVVKELRARDAKQNQRWDRLDNVTAATKRAPGAIPPPKYGPAAERRGEVTYPKIEEDQQP